MVAVVAFIAQDDVLAYEAEVAVVADVAVVALMAQDAVDTYDELIDDAALVAHEDVPKREPENAIAATELVIEAFCLLINPPLNTVSAITFYLICIVQLLLHSNSKMNLRLL